MALILKKASQFATESLDVSWSTPSYGKFAYVTYPHWR